MKSDRRLLVIFGAVFVVLVALVLLQSQPIEEPSPYADNRVFSGFTNTDVQAVRLNSPGEGLTFVLNRAVDGTWTAPEASGTLNAPVADLIARTMILLPYTSTLQPESDLSVYGFVPIAGLTVEFVLTDGTTHGIVVGFRNPTETGYYAAVDDRVEIYILERAAVDFLISVLRNPPVA